MAIKYDIKHFTSHGHKVDSEAVMAGKKNDGKACTIQSFLFCRAVKIIEISMFSRGAGDRAKGT